MEYRQKNPVPMPATGAYRSVKATIDILRFEHELDSVEQPEVAPPQELVQMLMHYMQERLPTAE